MSSPSPVPNNDNDESSDKAVEAFRPSPKSPTDSKDSTPKKPDFTYNELIIMAIKNSPEKRLTLQGIYKSIQDNHPYYRTATIHWKSSIRYNLSIFENFVRVQQAPGEKFCYWALNANDEDEMRVDRYGRLRPCAMKSGGMTTDKSQGVTEPLRVDTPPRVEPLGVPEPPMLPASLPTTPMPVLSPNSFYGDGAPMPFTPTPMLMPPTNVGFQEFMKMLKAHQQLQYNWIQTERNGVWTIFHKRE